MLELERDKYGAHGQLAEVHLCQKASADLQSGLEDQRARLEDQQAQLGRLGWRASRLKAMQCRVTHLSTKVHNDKSRRVFMLLV